jgi:translocation and assembly module TamB
MLGGHVLLKVDLRHLDENPASRIQAVLRGISLRSVQRSLRGADLKRIAIAGSLDGTVDAEWTGDIGRAKACADLSIHAPAGTSSGASTLPLNGKIHANYDGAGNTLALSQTSLEIPSATVTADGKINNRSDLQLHVAASDLRQLVALASGFTSTPPALQSISGAATMDANVRGSLHRPQISAQAHAQNLRVQGSDWKTADATFQADPSRIEVSNGNLESAQRGRASFAGTVTLHDWSYSPSNPIHANLSVQKMSVADLERIANLQYPVSGELSGTGSLSGSQLQPNGSGSFEIVKARVYDEPLQTVALRFHTQGSSIVSTLNIVANAGSANSSFTYIPASKAYTLRVEAPSIALQKLHAIQAKNLEVNGTLSLSVNGRGTFDNPQLSATLQTPRIDVRRNSITGMKASVEIANQTANLTLDSTVAQSTVRARGHVNLTGDYETDTSIDTTVVPLDLLLANLGNTLPQGFQGQTEFHATLKGPLKDKSRIEAHVTVPKLDASYQSLQLGAAGPIHADYSHSIVTLQPFEIRGTDTSVRVKGNIPLLGTTPADVTAQG